MARRFALVLVAACALGAAGPQEEIRSVLDAEVGAWNRGDIPGFVETYMDSPDTLFIGKEIARGRAQVLARYQKTYSDRDKMGKLAFSDLEIHLLGEKYANVVGRFHLERAPTAGGEASGVFTLLFEKTRAGWKIIQDHTS